MLMKQQYTLEFLVNSPARILYNKLSTANGLSEWFADKVDLQDATFTFVWNKMEQKATLLQQDNQTIRFKWEDDEDPETFFEFKVEKHDLTGEVSLFVTDFADNQVDKEDAIDLWDKQIEELRQMLGV